ncbi:MAG TPA: alpha-galactosidase [Ilumatobacteraceae bacterium]|nr:alpha-galactosidase [Ilumatobacteraceae bacterium]
MQLLAHLTNGNTSILITSDGGMPRLAHWGASLGDTDQGFVPALQRPVPRGGLDVDAPLGLIAEASVGWFGTPGLEGHRPDGSDFAPQFLMVSSDVESNSARFVLTDASAGLSVSLTIDLHSSGVATFGASISNDGASPYSLEGLRLSLPVPAQAQELLTVGGRWTNEFGQTRTSWIGNCVTVENRRGKTSHERLGVVFAGTPAFAEHSGEVWGCHIGWSGNYEITCDSVTDARRSVQLGELLASGEVTLQPGEHYDAPMVYTAYSGAGLNAVSNAFHAYMRSRPQHPATPRPVLLNIWEAVYFDHDFDTLRGLADIAASCGVERFVVDDGWFHSRRSDNAGLGDWWVDTTVWTNGLSPLIDHVRGLGMQFGIWVEPEMVNPDSDLYRAHPEWALVDDRYPAVMARNQLVLDLGRPEVCEYLFEHLHALLRDHDIAYVKWDMNRDLVAPTSAGRSGVHRQTLGVYALFDALRVEHPGVEFETCAGGGGRIDFGIFERTDRAWTSDSIDALDRQQIQRGFSLLFPPELMGTHIGSPVAHTTGRSHRLGFRAIAAMFGSLGIEWNLLKASDQDRADLAEIIAIHKRLRPLLHHGTVMRLDHPDPHVMVHGVVSVDQTEAVFACTRLSSGPSLHTSPIRLLGLDDDRTYDVSRIPIGRVNDDIARLQPAWLENGLRMTGRQLAAAGFNAPVLFPESSILLKVSAT